MPFFPAAIIPLAIAFFGGLGAAQNAKNEYGRKARTRKEHLPEVKKSNDPDFIRGMGEKLGEDPAILEEYVKRAEKYRAKQQQMEQEVGGGPAPTGGTVQPQAPSIIPTILEALVRGTMPEGARTTPMSLYGEGEAPPQLSPEVQFPQARTQQGQMTPGAVSERPLGEQPEQIAQAPAARPMAAPGAPALRRRSTLRTFNRNAEGDITNMQYSIDDEGGIVEVAKLVRDQNMKFDDAVLTVRGQGVPLSDSAVKNLGQSIFHEAVQRNKKIQAGSATELARQPAAAGRHIPNERQQEALAVLEAAADMGAQHADPFSQKILEEIARDPISDPRQAGLAAAIMTNPAYANDPRKQFAMLMQMGITPSQVGMQAPSVLEQARARMTPEEQKATAMAGAIVNVPSAQGPTPMVQTPGVPGPKPPMSPKESDVLTSGRTAFKAQSHLRELWRDVVQEGNNRLTDKFRQAISTSARAMAIENFTTKNEGMLKKAQIGGGNEKGMVGFTTKEKQFAAAYNALMGQLAILSAEPMSKVSDRDVVRIMGGIGNATLGPAQFDRQLYEGLKIIALRHNEARTGMDIRGVDVSKAFPLDADVGRGVIVNGQKMVYAGKDSKTNQPVYMTPQEYEQWKQTGAE